MTDPSRRTEEEKEDAGRKLQPLLLFLLLLLLCLLTIGIGDTSSGPGLSTSGPEQPASPALHWVIERAETSLPYAISGRVSRNLYPGGPAVPIAITFDSPNRGRGASGTRVSSLTVSIASVTGGGPRSNPCTAADFALTQIRAEAFPFYVPFGESSLTSLIGTGNLPTLRMHNRTDVVPGDGTGNQDTCKGATVHLAFRGKP